MCGKLTKTEVEQIITDWITTDNDHPALALWISGAARSIFERLEKEAAKIIYLKKKNKWLLSLLRPKFMSCGHERRFTYAIDGGTKYCVVCEAESLLKKNKRLEQDNEVLRWTGRMLLYMFKMRA